MAPPIRWTWVWASSGSWWWTGRPGVLQSMGSQRVRRNWATERNWRMAHIPGTSISSFICLHYIPEARQKSVAPAYKGILCILLSPCGHLKFLAKSLQLNLQFNFQLKVLSSEDQVCILCTAVINVHSTLNFNQAMTEQWWLNSQLHLKRKDWSSHHMKLLCLFQSLVLELDH